MQCENYCNTGGCTGYYVTREGHCSHCPEGAAACDDLTGEVRECRSGLGLVGGECRPCKVAGCQKCDGEQQRVVSGLLPTACKWTVAVAVTATCVLRVPCLALPRRRPVDVHQVCDFAGRLPGWLLSRSGHGSLVRLLPIPVELEAVQRVE